MSFALIKNILKGPKQSEAQKRLLDLDVEQQFIPKESPDKDKGGYDSDQSYEKLGSFVVGSGIGGMYLEQTFGFQEYDKQKKVKRLTLNYNMLRVFGSKIDVSADKKDNADKLFEEIPKIVAYCILFYSAVNNGMMPAWIMNIKAEKYLRVSWRFALQALFLFPFIMYEYRSGNEKVKSQYQLSHISKWIHMRKLYIASCSTTIIFGTVLFCADYTDIATAFILIAQTNFWLSLFRNKKDNHDIEIGGRIICLIGFLLICTNSYHFDITHLRPEVFTYIVTKLYHKSTVERILIGDCVPFFASSILAQISKVNIDLRQIFPPYLNSFIVSIFVSFNMLMVSYFVGGTELDFNSRYGWFGLFENGKFIGFFYMSTMLSLGVFISSILISKLFEPIIPASTALFEPIIIGLLCQVGNVQYFPSSIAVYGYVFLIPGQFIIILGQSLHQKQLQAEALKQQELQAMKPSIAVQPALAQSGQKQN